jgi:hypothetical protein
LVHDIIFAIHLTHRYRSEGPISYISKSTKGGSKQKLSQIMTEFEGIGYEDDYYCLYAWPRTFPLSSNESNGSNGAFRKAQKCDLNRLQRLPHQSLHLQNEQQNDTVAAPADVETGSAK